MDDSSEREFDWHPAKAASNQGKHGISFPLATTVFRDPLALSDRDLDHSYDEDRWVTLGRAEDGRLLVVVHTSRQIEGRSMVRIISARRAVPREARAYASEG